MFFAEGKVLHIAVGNDADRVSPHQSGTKFGTKSRQPGGETAKWRNDSRVVVGQGREHARCRKALLNALGEVFRCQVLSDLTV